jgi:hypothetical protein
MTALNDIAPWPRTEAEATADAVTKSLTVGAHARDRYIQTLNTADKEWGNQVGLLVNEFGVVWLLKFLTGHAINWSWWWVLAPLWISAAVALALFVMILLITITAALVSDDRRAGRRR